jgi:tetratricopeptide (TPR) repeat protein
MYTTALTGAALGDSRSFTFADQLEAMPSFRINAWRVRQIAHLYRGDAQQAEQCRRQVELLLIQQGTSQALRGTTLETEFMCYASSDDLLNLRRVLPELESLAERHPGWRPMFLVAQAELERIRGRLDAACALYKQVLDMVPIGRHMVWPHAAAFYVCALVDLGRAQEARRYAEQAAAFADAHVHMGLQSYNVSSALAYAMAATGDLEGAIARVDAVIAALERDGVSGMYAGLRYELRARLALQARDLAGFAEYFQRCRAHFGGTLDSPFTPRVARLVAEARRADLHVDAAELAAQALLQASVQRMRRELGLCADPEERAERALLLLVEATSARAGQLYGWHGGELKLLATTADAAPSERMRSSLLSFIGDFNQADQELTEVVGSDIALAGGGSTTLITDADGATYHPFPVATERASEPLAAVVALAFPTGAYRAPARELLAAVAEELLARGDVTAMTLMR